MTPFIRPGTPAYLRANLALFLAGFATFSLLYCVQPLLPAFAHDFHVSPAESSLALSLSTGLLAVAILGAAVVSSSMRRRPLMAGSMIGAALLNIVAGLVPDWHALLASRALSGLIMGGVPAVAMAYLAEEMDPKGLGMAMGLYVSGTAFGGMMGRVGVGIITEYSNWRVAMVSYGVLNLLTALGFIALLPASRHFVPRPMQGLRYHLHLWRGHLRQAGMPRLVAIPFLLMGAFVTVYNYVGFHLMAPPYTLSQTQIGLIFTVYLFGMASSSMAGALADRLGRAPVLIAGTLITLGGLGLSLLSSLAGLIAGIILLTTGFFVAHAVASGWVGRRAKGAKGHASSLYLLAYYLGSSTMGSVGGWFWSHGNWPAVVGMTSGLMLLALCLALSLRHLDTPSGRPAETPLASA